jgi:endonuclease G
MSSENNNVAKQVKELRERVEHIAQDVESLKNAGSPQNRALPVIEKDRVKEVLEPELFSPAGVIPPSPQDDVHSIVGGQLTSDFPDCCAVGNDQGFFCTGTLIARNLVVTAGHCTNSTRVFLKGSDIRVPDEGEVIRVSRKVLHPDADLQVLVLESNSTVTPRHVARGAQVGQPAKALLVGFGTTNLAGNIGYGRKRKVEVPIVSLECGTGSDEQKFGCRRGTELVAGHRGLLRDSCKGDSGGPLYVRGSSNTFHLLGVTSRGIINTVNVCGDGGIYVRVDKFLDWIENETGITIPA